MSLRRYHGTVHRLWVAITFLATAACGAGTQPASPAPGAGNPQSITGRERIGWDQAADSLSQLTALRYYIYVDGARTEIADTSCSTAAGPSGYLCSGKFPAMSNGSHTIELTAFTIAGDGTIIESARSSSLTVSVTAFTAAAAPGWADGQIETTRDGLTLRADKLAAGLDRPVDAAFVTDGRLLIVERAGRIRVVTNGEIQDPDALTLVSDDDGASLAVLSIAVDPDFARTRFVFVLHTADSAEGPVFRLSRYRELRGRLAERAVLFETGSPPAAQASAVARFGPDGKLYLALNGDGANGRLFRLNADGTMPRDQAGTTPAMAGGIADARGLGWDPRSGILWIADDDGDAAHISGLSMSAPPVRASVRGRHALRAGIGPLAFYASDAIPALRNDALIASTEGYILRLRFAEDDATRVVRSERLLEQRVGPVRVVTVGPGGAIYFCTDTTLGRLALALD
jgi:aldose sugar dehydrogenase